MTGDVLLLGVALILTALVVLGLIQALRTPRRHSRRIRSRSARRPSLRRSPAEVIERSFPLRLERASPTAPLSPPPRPAAGAPPSVPRAAVPAAQGAPPAGADDPLPSAAPSSALSPAPEESTAPAQGASPLEECRRLYEARRYRELLLLADSELRGNPAGMDAELAELWSFVGRSRQALDDAEGARAAFEEAIGHAPEADRATHYHRLAELASEVGHGFLSRVEAGGETTSGEERIATLRRAAHWLKLGALAAPEDRHLPASLTRALRGLWAAYGQTAMALLQRREIHGARRLLREALSDEDFPADRRDAFRDLLATTFTSEVEQLAAQAIRDLDEDREGEAVTLLQRAERVLASIPTDAIVKDQLGEMNRRLWWGYTKLGFRRVEAGQYADAIEPLFHALRIQEADPERQGETRAGLVVALTHLINERASRIHQLMSEGRLEMAVREGEWLRAVVEEGRTLGVHEEELAAALAVARPIMARLDRARTGGS